jgi:hypothetical protein
MYGNYNIDSFIISNMPNLTSISQGILYFNQNQYGKVKNIELINLPKVTTLDALFAYLDFEKIVIKGLDADEVIISNGSFTNVQGNDADLIIENNKGLKFKLSGSGSISSAFTGGSYKYVSIKNNEKLDALTNGFMSNNTAFNDVKIYIENNNSLSQITNSAFTGTLGSLKLISIKNNDNLERISSGVLYNITLGFNFNNGSIIIENNDKLETIQDGAFSGLTGTLDKISISNNKKLKKFSSNALTCMYNADGAKIKEFIISNNAAFDTIENSSISYLNIDKIKLEKLPSMTSLARYGAFGNLNVGTLDLSGTTITTIEPSIAISSSSIDTLILPPTITSMTGGQVASGVKKELYASGPNKCALNDFFVMKDSSGNITGYMCNPQILPKCN